MSDMKRVFIKTPYTYTRIIIRVHIILNLYFMCKRVYFINITGKNYNDMLMIYYNNIRVVKNRLCIPTQIQTRVQLKTRCMRYDYYY